MKNQNALALLALAIAASSHAAEFEVIQIGNYPGSNFSFAAAINNSGQVVGYSMAGPLAQGWRWSEADAMIPMPHGNGLINETLCYDINESGQITGVARTDEFSYAYRYTPGVGYTFLPVPGRAWSHGSALNDRGTVVGLTESNNNGNLPALWAVGSVGINLPVYNGFGYNTANDINNGGLVAGQLANPSSTHATITAPNGTITDLHGLFPGAINSSRAYGINDLGHTVGFYFSNDARFFPFVYRPGQMELPELPEDTYGCELWSINEDDWSVGSLHLRGTSDTKAGFYFPEGGLQDLNLLIPQGQGWVLESASDVNDHGWIVGKGRFMGASTTYLARPVANPRPVNGTVELQDLVGECQEPVKWELWQGTTLVSAGATQLGPNGEYSIAPQVTMGNYQLAFIGRTHLRSAQSVALFGSPLNEVDYSLTNGDVDHDNEVGPGDFGILANAFLSVDGDPNWVAQADLDCDGEVGPGDFGVLANNFLLSGWNP